MGRCVSMISEKMLKALNEQIKLEMESSYAYIAMEAYFMGKNLDGFANFFHIQAMEERDHAYLLFNYVYQVGGQVELSDLKAFDANFQSELDVMEKTLAHEQLVTRSIHNLMDIAMEEKDYASQAFLQWFIKEQVEEEETATALVEKMKMVGDNPNGLFMMNAELGKRVYHPAVMN